MYASAVADYRLAGWAGVLPVPPATKTPPPEGFTGASGRDPEISDIIGWAGTMGGYSVALRMPPGVIGIDVDEYTKAGKAKHGATTIAAHEQLWGPLPPTWSSTARGHGQPSRIMFFRAPEQRYATALSTEVNGQRYADVEVIQRHHRYAVVAPSSHADAGAPYAWYAPDGSPAAPGVIPSPTDLAELPSAWVAGLAAGASPASPAAAGAEDGAVLLAQLEADLRPECAEMTSLRLSAEVRTLEAEAGSRHDTVTGQVYAAVRCGSAGHPGAGHVLARLRDLWAELTGAEDRAGEFERMALTAARKAVSVNGTTPVPADPCLIAGGFVAEAPAADAPDATPLVDDQVYYPYQVIGSEAFDPTSVLDQPLAGETLMRTHPYMRWAYDARVWLLRRATRWEIHKSARESDMAQHACALVAQLMPRGDSSAEKGSPEHLRHQRHVRFNNASTARAIAAKMVDLVAGGTHPCAVKLGALDADPEILWAGGMPYDLRKAAPDVPVADWINQRIIDHPHVHSAAVAPQERPTPLWDAFCAAVFPDPEVRAYALCVMAVAVTGYSDRVLPILLGDSGRGKTQLVVLLMSLLGTYAHAADPKLLSPAAENAATGAIVYALRGRRLSFVDEGPREGRFAQERLKQLTGGGELTADDKYQSPVTWRPTHTLVLTTNDEPNVTDPAVRARTRIIPCAGDPDQVSATRAAIGPASGAAWRAEAPGVLHQLMLLAGTYLRTPAVASQAAAPAAIRDLAEQMATTQDPVLRWLAEEVEPFDPGTPSAQLYQQFVASCRQANMRNDTIPTQTAWGRALTRQGFPATKSEHNNNRPLRVRQGGFGVTQPAGGFHQNAGGLLEGLDQTLQPQKALSDQKLNGVAGGLEGLPPNTLPPARTHAPIRAGTREAPGKTLQPSSATPNSPVTSPDTPGKPSSQLSSQPSSRKDPALARSKRAEVAAAARLEAISAAAGEMLTLPCLVHADGSTVQELTAAQAGEFLDTITGALTVDVEHSGYPVGHRHFELRTVQLGCAAFAVVLDPTDLAQREVIIEALRRAPVLHAHSAIADLVPLQHAGLLAGGIESAWERMHDTVIPAKLADPASTGTDPGLKQLSATVLADRAVTPAGEAARSALFKAGKWLTETKPTTAPGRSGWAQVASGCTTMVRYAAGDVLDTAALAQRLPAPPTAVLQRERLVQRMTARVADVGLRIDGDHTRALLETHQGAADDAAARVRAAGIDNPGSNPQVGEALAGLGAHLPTTATGRASVRSDVLEKLRHGEGPVSELARDVLAYREHTKLISTYLEPYLEQVEFGDGRIRPTIHTLAADTGRMSSVRPNVQQVPRSGGIRACITADPGDLLVSADFSGVELRVAAALSGDQTLGAIMADPERDLHWEVARIAFGPQATKADRYAAKRGVFGRIYGGGVPTIAASVGVSEVTAQQIVDALDQLTPGLGAWSRGIRDQVKSGSTQWTSYSGRVIHLDPDLPHKAPNYLIQGTARELLVDAIVQFARTPWGHRVIVPVHDELVVTVPEAEAADATAALTQAMSSTFQGVPIVPEASAPAFAWQDSA